MKSNIQRTIHAQNRIAYIVYSSPKAAADLLIQYGYEPPYNIHELVSVIKELVQKKGMSAIQKLIAIHPEKDIILNSSRHSNNKKSTCKTCKKKYSSFSGDVGSFVDGLEELSLQDLKDLYDDLKDQSAEDPENDLIYQKMELVWNTITGNKSLRKEKEAAEQQKEKNNLLLYCGISLVVGIIIGSAS